MPKEVSGDRAPSHKSAAAPVLAAGAVLWRPTADSADIEVAVIHRPRYDDWSLPKGKVDPGESEPVTAVREIHEETGFRAVLGRRLGSVCYPVEQGTKSVRYWAARADSDVGGEFTPNDEVDKIMWLPVPDAMTRLEYPHDRKVLRRFTKQPADTHTVLIVRHGTAGRKSRYKGDDRQRPLDKHGRAQAESLVGLLLAFGATDLHAADRARCRSDDRTAGRRTGHHDSATSPHSPKRPTRTIGNARASALCEIAGQSGTRVICTQGKVIPDLVQWWCDRDGVRPDKSRNRKGGTWVLSLAGSRLVAADHIASPLAVRK